jgi:hypothetical protein
MTGSEHFSQFRPPPISSKFRPDLRPPLEVDFVFGIPSESPPHPIPKIFSKFTRNSSPSSKNYFPKNPLPPFRNPLRPSLSPQPTGPSSPSSASLTQPSRVLPQTSTNLRPARLRHASQSLPKVFPKSSKRSSQSKGAQQYSFRDLRSCIWL